MSENIGKVISLSQVLPTIFFQRGQLLNRSDYTRLVSSKDLADLIAILVEKSYKEISIGTNNATDLEREVHEYIVKTSFQLVNSAPLEMQTFLKAYMSKSIYFYLALALKSKINASIQLPTSSAINAYIWSQLKVTKLIEKIIQAKNVQELEVAVKKFPDYRRTVEEAMSLYWRYGSLNMIDLAFTKSYFKKVNSASRAIPFPDKYDIQDLFSIEVDTYNIIAIIRGKNWGFTEEILKELLVPNSFVISDKILKHLISLDSEHSIQTVVESRYGHQFLKREGLTLYDIELELKRILVRKCWKILLGNPFNYTQVFAVLKLIDVENQNLLAAIHGKDGRLTSDRISKYIIVENP